MFSLIESQVPSQINSLLRIAISESNLQMVEDCIKNGADLSYIMEDVTAIQHAALLNKWDVVEFIATLKKTNSSDSFRYSQVLEKAVLYNKQHVAIVLIMANANLYREVCNLYCSTIIHLAIEKIEYEIIECIIKQEPNLLKIDDLKYRSPIIHAAQLANNAFKNKNIELAIEYWNIVQMLAPHAKKAIENEVLPAFWEKRYGLNEGLKLVAKYGNIPSMLRLINAGAILNPPLMESDKTAFDLAAKYKQSNAVALCLYICPSLEQRDIFKRLIPYQTQEIQEITKQGKLWGHKLNLLIEKSILLLKAILSPKSIFSQIHKEIRPLFFVNLILSISKDLNAHTENTLHKYSFNINVNEVQIVNSVEKINLTSKILAAIKDYKEKYLFMGFSNAPKALNIFINDLKKMHNHNLIKDYIKNFIKKSDDWDNKTLIKEFLLQHELTTVEQLKQSISYETRYANLN